MADCKRDIFQAQLPEEIKRLVRSGVYLFPVRRCEKPRKPDQQVEASVDFAEAEEFPDFSQAMA